MKQTIDGAGGATYGGIALFQSTIGAPDFNFTLNAVDQATGTPLFVNNLNDGLWHHLSADLGAAGYAGFHISSIEAGIHNGTPTGTWDVYFANVALVRADGSVYQIFAGQDGASVANISGNTAAGSRLMTSGTERIDTANDPEIANTFYLADHLGTTQMEFSAGGAPVWRGEFAPFGEELDTQVTANHYKFTGKERDAESGLDYFGARYYASSMGRWMSPDPGKINPKHLLNPQKWNKYAYVLNNPLSLVDPDGLEEMWIQFRAFIPPAQVGVGPASGRGDNRTFTTQENASSRVSMTMHIETDPAKNNGNPLLGVTSSMNTTHNNLTGQDTAGVVVQAPTVAATQDANGVVNLNVQMNVHSGDLPASMGIRADVNIKVNEAGTQASVSGTTSVSPAFETNVAPQGGPTTNIPVQNAPSGSGAFLNGLRNDHQVDTGVKPIKQPGQQ